MQPISAPPISSRLHACAVFRITTGLLNRARMAIVGYAKLHDFFALKLMNKKTEFVKVEFTAELVGFFN
jgi:hypothetical protein